MTYTTRSAEETIALGVEIAARLVPPKLILLRGELGAGKTTLVKGIAQALGAAEPDDVTSPTFTLVHEYRGPRATIFHLDLYRLERERDLENIGFDDLREADALLLVEWGEKFASVVRDADGEITLERTGDTERRITLTLR